MAGDPVEYGLGQRRGQTVQWLDVCLRALKGMCELSQYQAATVITLPPRHVLVLHWMCPIALSPHKELCLEQTGVPVRVFIRVQDPRAEAGLPLNWRCEWGQC